MIVRVRLFASLRERAGAESIELQLPEAATVGDALRELDTAGPLAGLIGSLCVQMAVNREYATVSTVLQAEDELALIPPVSGGEEAASSQGSRWHVRITAEPLSLPALLEHVRSDRAGAIVIFEGVTREVPSLDYEAYEEMASPLMSSIVSDCIERHDLQAAAVEHRVGSVRLGEPSVIVAASAAHREQAFAGAREIIDRVKAQAPIWKREISAEGGAQWIHG